jgi:hypothetical protein
MLVLWLAVIDYRIARKAPHEWLGITLAALFVVHNIINLKFYTSLFSGRYSARRIAATAVNLLLVLDIAVIASIGLVQSKSVLSSLQLPGAIQLRVIHTTAAYWLIPLIGAHIGLHWEKLIKSLRRILKTKEGDIALTVIMRSTAVILFAAGVYSSFDRNMFAKLFYGFSFDYWPLERPTILYFAEMLSIMGMWGLIFTKAFKSLPPHRGQRQSI